MEIERKFRLFEIPKEILSETGNNILQGYLFTDPIEMRIRNKNGLYYITIKGSGELLREEWESEIEKWIFDSLWPLTKESRISKTRYIISHLNHKLEIDVFHKNLNGLMIMECEFEDIISAKNFLPPKWIGDYIEITDDSRYQNKNLAKYGHPR